MTTTESLLTFHSFNDEEVANDYAEKLALNNILFKIEKIPAILDSSIIGTSSGINFIIKLKSSDFEKAHEVLGNYYKSQIESIQKDYYLYEFTDKELYEILEKPDEWGYLDYQLANKILADRGKGVDSKKLIELKEIRNSELAKPEKSSKALIILGYCFFLFAGIVTILVGRYLKNEKKTLPDGKSVYSYPEIDRAHGNRMIKIGTYYLLFCISLLIAWIILS